MAEGLFRDYSPDLTELENKIGMKTPESLLTWMRDAPNCEGGRRSEVSGRENHSADFPEALSDKINNLKKELRWLRSADVRILRQLVALNEGIETMRWLLEDRGPLTSYGSSLTGSLSSLENGPLMSPCRENPDYPEELTEIMGENTENSNPKSYADILSLDSSEGTSPSPSASEFLINHSAPGSFGQTSFSPASGLNDEQPQDVFLTYLPPKVKNRGDTIRRVLLRSFKPRKSFDVETFDPAPLPRETQTLHQPQESFTASHTNIIEKEDSETSEEEVFLGYDARWSWVESEDDVTYV